MGRARGLGVTERRDFRNFRNKVYLIPPTFAPSLHSQLKRSGLKEEVICLRGHTMPFSGEQRDR